MQNVFEELDAPGEWYYDRETEILYFYPPEPLGKAPVVASFLDTAIRLEHASNITIRGITIETSRGEGVFIHGGGAIRKRSHHRI